MSKWEEGFNEVYCSIAFIPQMDNEKGKALLALARGNIDRGDAGETGLGGRRHGSRSNRPAD